MGVEVREMVHAHSRFVGGCGRASHRRRAGWLVRRKRRKRHGRLRGPVEAGGGGRNDRRRDLAAVPCALQDAAFAGLHDARPCARARLAQPGWVFPWQQPQAPAQTAPAPTGAGQFRTEAEARYRCPTDKVVWVNTRSKIYHYQGTRNYGTTKEGAYMCEADAKAAGDRAARTIVHHHYQG